MPPSFQEAWTQSPRNLALRTRRRAPQARSPESSCPSLLPPEACLPGRVPTPAAKDEWSVAVPLDENATHTAFAGWRGGLGRPKMRHFAILAARQFLPRARGPPPDGYHALMGLVFMRGDPLERFAKCWQKVLAAGMAGVHIGCLPGVNPLTPLPYSAGSPQAGGSFTDGVRDSPLPAPSTLNGRRDYVSCPIENGTRPHFS